MKLKEKQQLLPLLVASLIRYIYEEKHKCIIGFVRRCDDCKVGKLNSLHKILLAIDLELFSPLGEYLTKTEDHRKFGEFWEALNPLCSWGGHFGDGNHGLVLSWSM